MKNIRTTLTGNCLQVVRYLLGMMTLMLAANSLTNAQDIGDYIANRSDFYFGIGLANYNVYFTNPDTITSNTQVNILSGWSVNLPIKYLGDNSSIGIRPSIELSAPLAVSSGFSTNGFQYIPLLSTPVFLTFGTGPGAVYSTDRSVGVLAGIGGAFNLTMAGFSDYNVVTYFTPQIMAEVAFGSRHTYKLSFRMGLGDATVLDSPQKVTFSKMLFFHISGINLF